MNKYGIKKIGEKKFRQLCATLKKLKDKNNRSYMFGRFMGLFNPINSKGYQYYTEIKEYINHLNIGFMPNNIDSDMHHFVPYIRANKYLSFAIEGSISAPEFKILAKKVEKIKKQDPKKRNLGGIINIDEFIMMVVNFKMKTRKRTINND